MKLTNQQIMAAIVHKLESVQVNDGDEPANMIGEGLPVICTPGPHVTPFFHAP